MNLIKEKQLLIASLIYVLISGFVSVFTQPSSVINFIGPAAGIASAFTIIWGTVGLFSIIIGTIGLSLLLTSFNGVGIDLPVLLIAILAISLQSFSTKMLTHHLVRKQRWLRSLPELLRFILIVGPLTAIFSAIAVVIIAMVNTPMSGASIGVIFMEGWVASLLSAVFFIPTALLFHGVQRLSLNKRAVIVCSSVLGLVAIILLYNFSQKSEQHQRIDNLENVVLSFKSQVDKVIEEATEYTHALTGFFKASDYVSAKNFTTFSTHILHPNSSIRAFKWIPLIKDEERKIFEEIASTELGLPFVIREQLDTGQIIASATRASYLPVYYVYPHYNNKASLGINLLSQQDSKKTMEQALALNTAVASPPLTLVQDSHSNPAILVFNPVFDKPSLTPYRLSTANKPQSLTGYLLIIVQFDRIYNYFEGLEKLSDVKIEIQDITNNEAYSLYGNQMAGEGRLFRSYTFDAFERKYLANISEAQPWINQEKNWKTWTLLATSAVAFFVFQLLIYIMAAYTVELNHQGVLKTRRLKWKKELTEEKNNAKSHFLQTLGCELIPPVDAIHYFIDEFHQQPTFSQAESSLSDIKKASDDLTQLIDTLVNINDIEVGKVNVIQLSVFDLHQMLQKLETFLNASNKEKSIKFTFSINQNVPYLINSDELRIKKTIMALAQNAASLLNCSNLNISVKAHIHQFQQASVFFIFTSIDNIESSYAVPQKKHRFIDQDLAGYSTSMAMAKELCQLFDGDANLTQLTSGQLLLSASIKVTLLPITY